MDTGDGFFQKFDSLEKAEAAYKKLPKAGGIFTIGERLEIKGSTFRVKSIKPTELRLKLCKKT